MTGIAISSQVQDSMLGEELTLDECEILAEKMVAHPLKKDECLVKQNEQVFTLFVLIEGQLAVVDSEDANAKTVYTMTKGECAGTRAFVDRKPRTASLKAIDNALVYTLEPDAFESLIVKHPIIVYKVMRALFRITHRNLLRMNQESQQLSNYISKSQGRY